jgi:Lon protease-like protein
MTELMPIFPLEAVVYPGDALNLHIFEPRYKQLINDCAETEMPFAIPVVIDRKICKLGTLVQLVEITNRESDGQMDIRTRGLKVFRVRRFVKNYPQKLYSGAEVEYPPDKGTGDPKVMRAVLSAIKKLHRLLNVKKPIPKAESELTGHDVAHLAGLTLTQSYELLGLFDERERQEYLLRHLKRVLPVVAQMESLKERIVLNGHFKHLPGFDL